MKDSEHKKKYKDFNLINNRRFQRNGGLSVPGKTKTKPELIEDVTFNCALINCRSLKPKIKSLQECFNINKLSVALLNETWFYKSDKQAKHLLQEMKNETGIRKDRDSRGGGVAIAFNSNQIMLKKLTLKSLKTKPHFEIVAARGKLRGYKKEVNVFSCYLPPKLNRSESTDFLDTLSNAIAEAKTSSDGWFVVGGDWNNRSLTGILDMYPDLTQIKTLPIRKDNILAVSYTHLRGPRDRQKSRMPSSA